MDDFQTRDKRLDTVLKVQEPDRVPIMPKIDWFASRYAGITAADYLFQPEKAEWAVQKTWQDYGGWDIIFGTMQESATLSCYQMGLKCLLPGRELPPDSTTQYVEHETMTGDDYDALIKMGWRRFNRDVLLPRFYPGINLEEVDAQMEAARARLAQATRKWLDAGIPVLTGANVSFFAQRLGYARSLAGFIKDMFRRPDKIKEFAEMQTPLTIQEAKQQAKVIGIPRVFIGGGRISCDLISPRKWDTLVWPYLKKTIEELYADGIITYLHWDGDWIRSIPYLNELPKGSCFVDLDGYTDIFKAKAILKGHVCVAGDVPNNLLVMGTPREVTEYCKRLITVVGDGGGFIMSSGCTVPIDSRPENVRAMIETARLYGKY